MVAFCDLKKSSSVSKVTICDLKNSSLEVANCDLEIPSFDITICDFKFSNSSLESWNIKSSGKRSLLRLACSLSRFVSTPYNRAISDGLPVECPRVADNDKKDKFNPQFLGPDGKLDVALLFRSVLADKSLEWFDLQKAIMQAAYIYSPRFADTLINERSVKASCKVSWWINNESIFYNDKQGFLTRSQFV